MSNTESGWPPTLSAEATSLPQTAQRNGRPLRHLYFLFPLLVACAPSAPSQYEQGAYRPPVRAPVFNPATGAPHTVGQPGHLDPNAYPRSPYTRVLPETPETRREPGIWAANPPRTSVKPPKWEDREPVVLGIELPEPDDSSEAFRMQNRICAEIFARFDERYMKGAASTWGDVQRRCFVAFVYAECAQREKKWHAQATGVGKLPHDRSSPIVADWHFKKAQEYLREKCMGSGGVPVITEPVMDWSTAFRGYQGNEADWR